MAVVCARQFAYGARNARSFSRLVLVSARAGVNFASRRRLSLEADLQIDAEQTGMERRVSHSLSEFSAVVLIE